MPSFTSGRLSSTSSSKKETKEDAELTDLMKGKKKKKELQLSYENKELKQGNCIETPTHKFVVVRSLETYYSSKKIYSVKDVIGGETDEFILKTIDKDAEEDKHELFKKEVRVLKAIDAADDERHQKHFARFVDMGATPHFKFIVTDSVGPSLTQLRDRFCGNKFSFSSALYLCIETLEAIEHLHKLGFLHYRISPYNFRVGTKINDRVVYMASLSLTKTIKKPSFLQELRERSSKLNLYAYRHDSIAYHENRALSKKDNIESWLYLAIDLIDEKVLPWGFSGSKHMYEMKKMLYEQHDLIGLPINKSLDKNVPTDFHRIINYMKLQAKEKADRVDVAYIMSVLRQIEEANGIDHKSVVLDWEGAVGDNWEEETEVNIPVQNYDVLPNYDEDRKESDESDEEGKYLD